MDPMTIKTILYYCIVEKLPVSTICLADFEIFFYCLAWPFRILRVLSTEIQCSMK